MGTTNDYRDYIVEQLSELEDIECKPMMGEYLLYYQGVLFGGIYDNRFLIKKTDTNQRYSMQEQLPYEGAKRTMYVIEDVDQKEKVKEIVIDTCRALSRKK